MNLKARQGHLLSIVGASRFRICGKCGKRINSSVQPNPCFRRMCFINWFVLLQLKGQGDEGFCLKSCHLPTIARLILGFPQLTGTHLTSAFNHLPRMHLATTVFSGRYPIAHVILQVSPSLEPLKGMTKDTWLVKSNGPRKKSWGTTFVNLKHALFSLKQFNYLLITGYEREKFSCVNLSSKAIRISAILHVYTLMEWIAMSELSLVVP